MEINPDNILQELDILLSGKTMKKLSGNPKKCYKYSLVAIFINTCMARQYTLGQEENFEIVYDIKENPKQYLKSNTLDLIRG